jgi:hypothetical protein
MKNVAYTCNINNSSTNCGLNSMLNFKFVIHPKYNCTRRTRSRAIQFVKNQSDHFNWKHAADKNVQQQE